MNNHEEQELDVGFIFEVDGSFRDIYVLETTLDDWQELLNQLHHNWIDYSTEYYVNNQLQETLTQIASNLFDEKTQISRLIKLDIGNVILNSHCFTKSEIEFDIDPNEVTDKEKAHLVFEFIKRLGNKLEKPIRLTPENSQEIILYEYKPKPVLNKSNWKSRRSLGTWVFCQDCKRCYITGEERVKEDWIWCAYDDCEYGDTYDAVEWHIIKYNYPNFPNTPERDVRYDLSKSKDNNTSPSSPQPF